MAFESEFVLETYVLMLYYGLIVIVHVFSGGIARIIAFIVNFCHPRAGGITSHTEAPVGILLRMSRI